MEQINGVRKGSGIACEDRGCLEWNGASLEAIRAEVKKLKPTGNSNKNQKITLDPGAKRVVDLAYDEARNLNNNYVGTEHLLLGLN